MTLKEYWEARKNGKLESSRSQSGQKDNRRKTKGERQQRRKNSEKSQGRGKKIEQTRSKRPTTPQSEEILSCFCGKQVKYAGTLICEDCYIEKVVAYDPKKIANINTFIARGD